MQKSARRTHQDDAEGGMRERESKVDFEITPRETIEAAHIQYTVWLKLQ